MATAKQLAARRKFARIMKSGGFKKKKKGTTKGMVRKTARRAFEGKRKTTTKRRVSKTIKRRLLDDKNLMCIDIKQQKIIFHSHKNVK